MKKVAVYIPDTLKIRRTGFLKGFARCTERSSSFYITSDLVSSDCSNSIGYCGDSPLRLNQSEWIYIDNSNGRVEILDTSFSADELNVVCIYYDYEVFRKSNAFHTFQQTPDSDFNILHRSIHSKKSRRNSGIRITFAKVMLAIFNLLDRVLNKMDIVFRYSSFFAHVHHTVYGVRSMLTNMINEESVSLSVANDASAIVLDVLLGLLLTYFLQEHDYYIVSSVQQVTEFIINLLKQVLHKLMDSPAGLKLNYSLNQTLAIFFFYHISLWKAFIQSTAFLIPGVYSFFKMCGIFGVSFQVSILSDVVSFLTFHVYCIYVYAARLYGLEIYGVLSFWKLFIGRKYNPLRSRVDSFQYSYNQLFVSTLGFTVLIFLFPTIFLYYAVFTIFRVLLIAINELLNYLRLVLKSIPVYVTLLWILGSSGVNGSVILDLRKGYTDDSPTLHVTLKKCSFWKTVTSVSKFRSSSSVRWSSVFRGFFSGILL